MHIYIHTHTYTYIYIYIERERETGTETDRDRERSILVGSARVKIYVILNWSANVSAFVIYILTISLDY